MVVGGRRHDGVIVSQALFDVRVSGAGGGCARAYPESVLADRAYGACSHLEYLRSRGIRTVIAEKRGRNANEEKRVSKGGRPLAFGAAAYRNRYVVERSFAYV